MLTAEKAREVLDYNPETGAFTNHDRSDNRWVNLRQANRQQNARNTGLRAHSKSRLKGVRLVKRSGRWVAQICIGGKIRGLGSHSTKEGNYTFDSL